jgi:hypothetical protein
VLRNNGYVVGDTLLVREYDEQKHRVTGSVAMFSIEWVTKAADHAGMLSGLLTEDAVVLGLQPANFLVMSPSLQLVAHTTDVAHAAYQPRTSSAPTTTPRKVPADAAAPPPAPPVNLAETARSEASRLRELAKERHLDQRALAEAVYRELMRAPTLPAVSGSRASPVALAS